MRCPACGVDLPGMPSYCFNKDVNVKDIAYTTGITNLKPPNIQEIEELLKKIIPARSKFEDDVDSWTLMGYRPTRLYEAQGIPVLINKDVIGVVWFKALNVILAQDKEHLDKFIKEVNEYGCGRVLATKEGPGQPSEGSGQDVRVYGYNEEGSSTEVWSEDNQANCGTTQGIEDETKGTWRIVPGSVDDV